jgi:hypothetical protein
MVAQPLGRLEHAARGPLADRMAPVQHPVDGRDADARGPRQVDDCRPPVSAD